MAASRTVVVCVALALAAATSRAQPPTHSVTLADGLVAVEAFEAPLAAVVETLASRGLVEVTGIDRLSGNVTIKTGALPVADVVTALLAGYSFVMTTRPRPGSPLGPLVMVLVQSQAQVASAPSAPRGAIIIPELEALRSADREAEAPDPDEEPDLEDAADQATENADRSAQYAELERTGAFDRKVPVDVLADMRDHDNPLVRGRVLTELDARDARAAIDPLIQALGDEDLAVRTRAVDLLGQRSDAESLRRLGATLVRSQDTALRAGAFIALAMRADPASIPFVEAVADDRDITIRAAAARFLAEMTRRSRGPALPAGRPLPPLD